MKKAYDLTPSEESRLNLCNQCLLLASQLTNKVKSSKRNKFLKSKNDKSAICIKSVETSIKLLNFVRRLLTQKDDEKLKQNVRLALCKSLLKLNLFKKALEVVDEGKVLLEDEIMIKARVLERLQRNEEALALIETIHSPAASLLKAVLHAKLQQKNHGDLVGVNLGLFKFYEKMSELKQ